MPITAINTSDAKEKFLELLDRVAHSQERIVLTRRGKDIAAIIPMSDLQHILSLQDRYDLQEAINALKEARQLGTISLEELKESAGGQ